MATLTSGSGEGRERFLTFLSFSPPAVALANCGATQPTRAPPRPPLPPTVATDRLAPWGTRGFVIQ